MIRRSKFEDFFEFIQESNAFLDETGWQVVGNAAHPDVVVKHPGAARHLEQIEDRLVQVLRERIRLASRAGTPRDRGDRRIPWKAPSQRALGPQSRTRGYAPGHHRDGLLGDADRLIGGRPREGTPPLPAHGPVDHAPGERAL